MSTMRVLVWGLVVLVLGLVGCGGSKRAPMGDYSAGGPSISAEMSRSYAAEPAPGYPMEELAADSAGLAAPPPPQPSPDPVQATPAAQRMVHYDGYLRLRVGRTDEGVDAVEALAQRFDGRVEHITTRSVVIRVPVDRFQDAFAAALDLGEVMDRRISARDVTDAFTAVELRLRTARATLDRLQELLARSEDEKERLQLLRQIEQLTTEIDRTEAQQRTLADLASLSRLSVDLVPREALAWQDADDETLELSWIRRLSPFDTDVDVKVRPLDLAVPEGMVRLEPRGPYVAEAADTARVWSHRLDNDPQGDAAFWLAAVEGRLAQDFATAEVQSLGGWRMLRLVERGRTPYVWWIAVRVDGKALHLFQAWLPSIDAEERHRDAILAVLAGGAA